MSLQEDEGTGTVKPEFQRLALITGEAGISRLAAAEAAVFGLGGVGSWAAEALVRSGVGAVTLVDSDFVCVTNLNRQLQATWDTIGAAKTEALSERLSRINPRCRITAMQRVFDASTLPQFFHLFQSGTYILDAIDSLAPKLDLIEAAAGGGAFLVSCMGMAQKLDPTQIRVAPIWDTLRCPLAKLVRTGLRKRGFTGSFPAVYSEERLPLRREVGVSCGTADCLCCNRSPGGEPGGGHEWCSSKLVINGSAVTVTAAAGMALAGVVIRRIVGM